MIKSKNLTGGQAAIKSLKKEKVKHVFGLIGSATMEMFDALYHEKNIKFIGVRDERTGAHIQQGDVFYEGFKLPEQIYNHEICSLLSNYLIDK